MREIIRSVFESLTRPSRDGERLEGWVFALFVAAGFSGSFSMPTGRALLGGSFVLLVFHLVRTRRPLVMTATGWLMVAFSFAAIFSTVVGVNPSMGFSMIVKLVWLVGIPVGATVLNSGRRLRVFLMAVAIGVGVTALDSLVTQPLEATAMVTAGTMPSFLPALIYKGSMTDGQRLLIGILLATGFLVMSRREGRRTGWWWVLLVLDIAALLIHFKRGSWICAAVLSGALVCVLLNWRWLFLAAAVILTLGLLPPVRARIVDIRDELDPHRGGRLLMWTDVAPDLVKKYPLGVGWRCVTSEMMRKESWRVEPNRNHLHSNLPEVAVETGLLGLGIFLAWMGAALFHAGFFLRRDARRGEGAERIPAVLILFCLLALYLNGLVEYNFGDAEIVLLYVFLVGAASAAFVRCRAAVGAPPEDLRAPWRARAAQLSGFGFLAAGGLALLFAKGLNVLPWPEIVEGTMRVCWIKGLGICAVAVSALGAPAAILWLVAARSPAAAGWRRTILLSVLCCACGVWGGVAAYRLGRSEDSPAGRRNLCMVHMKRIVRAKHEFAVKQNMGQGGTAVLRELAPFLDKESRSCPNRGDYQIGRMGSLPRCTEHGPLPAEAKKPGNRR